MSAALPLPGKAIVVQVINGQPVTIEVDGTNAPLTAGNFVDLVERVNWERVVLLTRIPIRRVLFLWKLSRKAPRNLFTTKL